MIRIALVTLWLVLSSLPVTAQDDFAAVITINYPGVEIRRVNTETWIELSEGAVAPFGAGDRLRTDGTGRAYLTFLDRIELLIMPNTTYEITSFAQLSDGQVQLHSRLDGHAIQRSADTDRVQYEVDLRESTLTRSANLFAMWSNFEDQAVITVVSGSAEASSGDEMLEIQEREGLLTFAGTSRTVSMTPPYNAARLLSHLDGCVGQSRIIDAESLNVRAGTGTGYGIIGYLFDDIPVTIMGTNETATWYRLYWISGFGWVEALAVDTDCEEMTVFPNLYAENNALAYNIDPLELELLQPFYGKVSENWGFYLFAEEDEE